MGGSAKLVETSTDYARPHRPLPVALLNGAGRVARGYAVCDGGGPWRV